jgi:hypothetical protein
MGQSYLVVQAALEQRGELPLLLAGKPREHRGLRERGDQTAPSLQPGCRQRERLDAPVPAGTRARDEPTAFEPVDTFEGSQMQSLGELPARQWPELRIELPQGIGEGY